MKTAVVLFNLGGPDAPRAVEPFLFNLFSDPAIIALPNPIRWLLARFIAGRRAQIARGIYENLGGGSPIVANTEIQAAALGTALGAEFKVFIAMRYWHPRAKATVEAVKAWAADRVILLPLYPQYSTTTTASSVREWMRCARRAKLPAPTTLLCCYPHEPGFVGAIAQRVRDGLASIASPNPRVLFSAHGLPKNIVDGGDPYAWQVEHTVSEVVAQLDIPGLDYTICYQSRVGPREWLSPSTDSEIHRAGKGGTSLVIVPIAFVSEHSETLVELDIEYRHLADQAGVPSYVRVPTVDALPSFIEGLARLTRAAVSSGQNLCSAAGERLCPLASGRCAYGELVSELGRGK